MSLKKFIDNKEIYIKKNEKINKQHLESFSYNTLLNFEKLLEKNNTKKSRSNTKTKTKTKSKSKSGSNTKSNMIKRLIKREVIYNDLIELYYDLNPLLKKVPEDVYEIILKKIKNLQEKDTNNKKINDILTEYFDDFKYSVIYGIRDVNNEYDIDNMFLAKKLSIDSEIINQHEKIKHILDVFSKNILGKLLQSKNKLDDCIERLKEIIIDVDDLEFENEDLIDEIYQQINEAKLSYNEFIKNQNNTMKYGITIFKQIEININNEIKKINENLNRFKSLIQFPNLEYISSKKYESVSSKKVRSLDINKNKNKRKTLKNRYISK